MIGEELKQAFDEMAVAYDRKRQQADRMPDNIAVQRAAQDALVALQNAEIKLLRHALKLLQGALNRRGSKKPNNIDPLGDNRR